MPTTGVRDWWNETAEIAERARRKAEESVERKGLSPTPRTYECHCGAIERQDCYCWDRRPSLARTVAILVVIGGLGAFWYLVIRWVSDIL